MVMVTFSGIISSHDFGTFSISSGNGCKKFYKPTNVKLIKNKPCVVMYDEKEKKETIRTKYIFCILQENKFVFCKEQIQNFSGHLVYIDKTGFIILGQNGGRQNFKHPTTNYKLSLHSKYEVLFWGAKTLHIIKK